MKTIQTATILIALVAMISMTGLAMAGSTTATYNGDGSYDMNFGGSGTGSLYIGTHTSYGDDYQYADWSNADIDGSQGMTTSTSWTQIDRDTTVTGVINGAMATGRIEIGTTDKKGDSITELALYHDNSAGGSNVAIGQTVWVGSASSTPIGGPVESGVGAITEIAGYAYGADTQVMGSIQAVSNGQNNVGVYAVIDMSNGAMHLDAGIGAATISGSNEEAIMGVDMYGNGDGVAQINGQSSAHAYADFDFGVTNDGAGYTVIGNINGDPISVNLFDNFDTNYDASGYIYIVN